MTEAINHEDAVSFLISAKQALGCTGSIINLGDHKHHIAVIVDKSAGALVGMIHYQKIGNSYICRLIWSAQEMDDGETAELLRCSLRVSAVRTDTTPRLNHFQ